ncbi:MAG: MCE family protein [Flavobacteriales bacterium]|nr:MCE family protein [Flavobacteriales bacterium]
MKISRETYIGLIAVLAIALAFWGFNWLKKNDLFSKEVVFYSVYKSVDGLIKDRPVTLNGFQVGYVKDVRFHPNGSGDLLVTWSMQEDFPISKNAIAEIYAQDLLGSKAIRVNLREGPAAISGDTLIGHTELSLQDAVNQEVAPIKRKAEELLVSLDSVITYVQAFFDKDSRKQFENTFTEVEKTFTALESTILSINRVVTGNEQSFNSIIVHLDSISNTLEGSSDDYAKLMSNMATVSDTLAKVDFITTMNELNSVMARIDSITARIEAGEGTLGKLSQDEQLYDNLERSTEELSELLYDLKMNPSRYVRFSVFGGNKKYEEPVEEEKEE